MDVDRMSQSHSHLNLKDDCGKIKVRNQDEAKHGKLLISYGSIKKSHQFSLGAFGRRTNVLWNVVDSLALG